MNENGLRTYEDGMQDNHWLAENSIEIHEKYRGEWIAVYFKKIIAHDRDFAKVAEVANQANIHPLYMQVPEHDTIAYAFN